jgi:hypothetical protein
MVSSMTPMMNSPQATLPGAFFPSHIMVESPCNFVHAGVDQS